MLCLGRPRPDADEHFPKLCAALGSDIPVLPETGPADEPVHDRARCKDVLELTVTGARRPAGEKDLLSIEQNLDCLVATHDRVLEG